MNLQANMYAMQSSETDAFQLTSHIAKKIESQECFWLLYAFYFGCFVNEK